MPLNLGYSTVTSAGKRSTLSSIVPPGITFVMLAIARQPLTFYAKYWRLPQSATQIAILEQVMAHPSVPMHGPEHHAMVPGVIIAAVRNAGYPVPEGAIEKALERASKVPGGWCGLYGDCGAAVGVGIAVSVLTNATPLTGKQRSLALRATSFALARMLDDQPRCCKRASRIAVEAAVDFLKEHLNIILPKSKKPRCTYSPRNKQCAQEQCPFYDHSDNAETPRDVEA